MQIIAIIACLFSVQIVTAIKWIDCGAKNVKSVSITGCESSDVCPLPRGTNVTVNVDFTAGEDTASAKVVVHGIIAGLPTPFPMDNPDACDNKGISCPIKKDSSYKYHEVLPVKSIYPTLSLVVKWELKDASDNDILCIEIPVKIQKKKDTKLYFKSGQNGEKHENSVLH